MSNQIPDINNGILDLGLNEDLSPDPKLELDQIDNNNDNKFVNDINGSFVIDFAYAYSLRELFKLLTCINCEVGTFVIRQDGILYVNNNGNNRVITTIKMHSEQFVRYEFSSSTGTILLALNIKMFYSILSKIAKSESFRIYKQGGDNRVYFQVLSDTKSQISDDEVAYINPEPSVEIKDFTAPQYNRSDIDPNCVISTGAINNLCKDMKTTDCESMRFYFFPKGLHVAPIKFNKYRAFKFGQVDESANATPSLNKLPITNGMNRVNNVNTITKITVKPRNLVEEFNLHKTFVYSLSGINNINPRGVVKFYAENNKPLKIVSSIGDYGTLQLFITKN